MLFTANGTTSGVRIPNYDWVPANRKGLTFVDATSAAFAQPVDWSKVDVLTFSWQKVLGGEAAHGMLILSPRAVARLESYTPAWPLPKVFRLTKSGGKLIKGVFEGETINTPSMLCVEDYLDALAWAQSVGGLAGLMSRANANAKVLFDWDRAHALDRQPRGRSGDPLQHVSVCLKLVDPALARLTDDQQKDIVKAIAATLEKEGVAMDIANHRDAPASFRIWTGATVETSDVEALTPWLDWAYAAEKAKLAKAA